MLTAKMGIFSKSARELVLVLMISGDDNQKGKNAFSVCESNFQNHWFAESLVA
jgi:hypothetical protein